MTDSVHRIGNRVHTPNATYTFDDALAARHALERFRHAEAAGDEAVAAVRRYKVHLDVLLDGAGYESKAPIDAIDPAVLELPKKKQA